ncbi:MAG: surface protein [Flavipsychrobacter sp.]|nr:surface protein [Flavipsychrobacter sp.]
MSKSTIKFFLSILFCCASQFLYAQVADFVASDTSGCAPKIISFTNMSSGATSYSWNLGNGSPLQTSTDVSASYTLPGTYTITLTAFNGPSSTTKSLTIRVYAAPTVSFTSSDTAVCPGTAVTFTSTSVSNAWGAMTNNWNFGDGGSSSSYTPTYVYTTPGYYNVTLFATNAPGCTGSLAKNALIHVFDNSIVNFSATPTSFCKTPQVVTFSNTSTGIGPLSYLWRFGDGGTSTLPNPTHSYGFMGSYNVRLTVKNAKGCYDSVEIPNYVNAGSLTAAFTSTTTICAKDVVTFNNTSSTHLTSQWYFGDGNSSTDEMPVYAYSGPGTYTVKLIVFDGACYDSVTHNINVLPLPLGSFTSSPLRPCFPPTGGSTSVIYTASVSGGTSVNWLFGDGTTGSGPTITKVYPYSLIDYVDMNITNAAGCKNTIERIDSVFNLYLNPQADATSGCSPVISNFSVTAYSVIKNNMTGAVDIIAYPYPISSYDWDFADGTPHGSGLTPTHTFTAPGVYNVVCKVVTSNGCTQNNVVAIAVGKKPTATFTVSPSHMCAGRTVTVTASSTDPIDKYQWIFGDGVSDMGPTLIKDSHTYSVPAIFDIGLVVEQYGCPGITIYKKDTVDSPSATIYYTYDCIPNNSVTFKDTSYGDDQHLWQFGDGATSTVRNLGHAYPALSSYIVTLSTYNIRSGCRDTAKTFIDLRPPTITFKALSTSLCRDRLDTLRPLVFGSNTPVTRYDWYTDWVLTGFTFGPSDFLTSFKTLGLHTLALVVTDTRGCYDTLTKPNYILTAKPTDNFSFTPTTLCGPAAVNFTDASTDVTGTVLTNYSWTFGDGAVNTNGGPTPVHMYTAAGVYSVKEIVTDNLGCKDTLTHPTKINVFRPVPAFVASNTSICRNRSVHFNNTSTLCNNYLWLFGDGSTSTLATPDHIYTTSGTFTVKLVGFDLHGCIDTMTKTNYINVNPSPTSSFTMSDTFAVCPPLNVKFTNTSTGATSYSWAFGDGTFSVATSPSAPYVASGLYIVRLVAKNGFACTDTSYGRVSIFGYKGAFTYKPLTGCSPMSVRFKSILTTTAYTTWDFNDGVISGPSLADTAIHVYTTPGYYIPKLILTDTANHCSSFSVGADTIRVDTLIPDFSINPTPACKSANVVFHDMSTTTFSPPSSWAWTFGDGGTSTAGTNIHVFTTSGTYSVTLTATNGYGCSGTVTKNILVNPAPSPITGNTTICVGNTSNLTDLSPGGTWSSSSTTVAIGSSSGIVTGVFAGTATIAYTATTGCTASVIMKVNPNPAIIAGATGICFGQTSTLSDATPGGVWSSSNTAVATIGTSGTVSTVSLGTATVTYLLPTTGCINTATVTVATAPKVITGNKFVCFSGTSGLSDTVSGGVWTSTNTAIATIDPTSGIVNGIALGTAIISYSLGTGCTVSTTVTVITTPAPITGLNNVCAGLSISLSDPTPSGKWTSSNTFIATAGSLSGVVTGVSGGTATIYYTLNTGCSSSAVISVNPTSPITGMLNICNGNNTILGNLITGGTWTSSTSSVATIGGSSGFVTSKSVGTTIIKYTAPTGCSISTPLNVISVPADIIGAVGGVCSGKTIMLSDPTPAGTWTSDNTTIATIDPVTGLVKGFLSGTTLVYYSIGTGCIQKTTVTVHPNIPITGPKNVCSGQTITLEDTALGGTWTSSNTSVATIGSGTGIATGLTPGTTTINYILSTGCIQLYTVTTLALPAVITGTTNVCAGLTTKLSDATTGGTWTSSNPTTATINLTSGLVNASIAGSTTITYTAGGCYRTTTVTVNPLPAPITGSTIGCYGSTTMLSDATIGGTWSSSNTKIGTIDPVSGMLTGVLIGTTTITYKLSTGCIATRTQLLNPPPAAIIGTPFACEGLTTALSDFTSAGTWNSGNTTVATVGSTGLVTGLIAGTSTITYTVAGCGAYKTVTINPLPPAISGPDAVCVNAAITLTDIGSGTWVSSTPSVAVIGISSGTMTGVSAGVDTITYTLATGCITTTTITVNPLPAPITGLPYMCTTLTTQLSDATGTGAWSSDNTTIADVDASGLVTGYKTGFANISYTIPTGCVTATSVQVFPFPKIINGPSNICHLTPVTFTDTIPGGIWSSDNTSIAVVGSVSGTVTGVNLGTTTITYTIASSCSVSHNVSVMPLPVSFNITGGGNYCSADTGVHIGLTGSVVGTNYFLYKGTSIATGPLAGTGNVLDFGLQKAPGVYTVVATIAATGCSTNMPGSATVSVTTSVIPSITLYAKDTICNGATTSLTSSITNGGLTPAYSWFINGTKVTTATSYSYIPADKDIVTVRLFSSAACAEPDTASATHIMTVLAPQVPSAVLSTFPGDTICSGEKMTFTAIPTFGGSSPTYTWNVNTVNITTGPTFTYLPTTGDIVYAEIKSNYICRVVDSAPSNSVAVTVQEPVVPSAEITATPGANLAHNAYDTLVVTPVNAGSNPAYQWFINGYPVAGATTNTFISNNFNTGKPDSVTCVVTSSGACKITTHAWIYITVNFLGVKNLTVDGDLSIVPNPNKGEFVLKGSLGTVNDEDVSIEITDLLGQVVYKQKITAKNGDINEHISLGSTLANSMYLLNVRSGAQTKVFHIVVER